MRFRPSHGVCLRLLLGDQISLLAVQARVPLACHRQFALNGLQASAGLAALAAHATDLFEHGCALEAQVFHQGIFHRQRVLYLLQAQGEVRLGGMRVFPRRQRHMPLPSVPDAQQTQQFVARAGIVARPPRLLGQRRQPWLDLADYVVQTRQIALCQRQLLFGVIALSLKLADAGGVFEESTALLSTLAERLIYQALPNDGVGIVADSRLRQQKKDILEARPLAVEEIFVVAGAKAAARRRDLGILGGKPGGAVVQHQPDLRHVHRRASCVSRQCSGRRPKVPRVLPARC